MPQPLQHQHAAEPSRIVVIRPSRYFTPGVGYAVLRWLDGCPWVHNDTGSKTWLTDPRSWAPVRETIAPGGAIPLMHPKLRERG